MAKIIEIIGHGLVSFPDEMEDDAIVSAIKRNFQPINEDPKIDPASDTPENRSAALSRPQVKLETGEIATVRSVGITDDKGHNWVIPTIVDSKPVSEDEAISLWKSGKNQPLNQLPLPDVKSANDWAQRFHLAEERRIQPPTSALLAPPPAPEPPKGSAFSNALDGMIAGAKGATIPLLGGTETGVANAKTAAASFMEGLTRATGHVATTVQRGAESLVGDTAANQQMEQIRARAEQFAGPQAVHNVPGSLLPASAADTAKFHNDIAESFKGISEAAGGNKALAHIANFAGAFGPVWLAGIAAGPAGVLGTFWSQGYENARQSSEAYLNNLDPEHAAENARTANKVGLLSGTLSAALAHYVHLVPGANKVSGEAIEKLITQATAKQVGENAVKLGVGNIVKESIGNALSQGAFTAGDLAVAKATYRPDLTLPQAGQEMFESMAGAGIFGGAMRGAREATRGVTGYYPSLANAKGAVESRTRQEGQFFGQPPESAPHYQGELPPVELSQTPLALPHVNAFVGRTINSDGRPIGTIVGADPTGLLVHFRGQLQPSVLPYRAVGLQPGVNVRIGAEVIKPPLTEEVIPNAQETSKANEEKGVQVTPPTIAPAAIEAPPVTAAGAPPMPPVTPVTETAPPETIQLKTADQFPLKPDEEAELRKVLEATKGEPNAIPIESTAKVDVPQPPGDGEAVGQGNAEHQAPAGASEPAPQVQTPRSPETVGVRRKRLTPAAPPAEEPAVAAVVPGIKTGDWIEWIDDYGKTRQGKVTAVFKTGRFIPGFGAEKPRIEYATDAGTARAEQNPKTITEPAVAKPAPEAETTPKVTNEPERPTSTGQPVENPPAVDVREPAGPGPETPPREEAGQLPGPEIPASTGGGAQAQEPRVPGTRGVRRGAKRDTGAVGGAEPERQPAPADTQRPAEEDTGAAPRGVEDQNHVLPRGEDWLPKGDKAKVRSNLDAIKLLKTLEQANRNPTPEEKSALAKYVGWGGLKAVFDEGKAAYRNRKYDTLYGDQKTEFDRWEKNWGKIYDEVKKELTPEEWNRAAKSILNAHYTSRTVINGIWDAVQRLGFKGGVALEPAGGIGHFIGLQPEQSKPATRWAAVELDDVSSRILKRLYPEAKVQATGFEKARIPNNSLDLAISNVPFAKEGPIDARYPRLSLHNYFFARALDAVKPGGLVAFITSMSTMDNATTSRTARDYIAERADLVGAIRLPNTAFKENAGTEVTTDILFFRKRDGTPFQGQPFTRTVASETYKGEPVEINEYFAAHPEMMLGRMSLEGTMRGENEPALIPTPGAELEQQLRQAVEKLPANVFGAQQKGSDIVPEAGETSGGKIGGLIIRDGNPVILQPDGSIETPEWASKAAKVAQAKHYISIRDKTQGLIDRMLSPESEDADIASSRNELNALYDDYVKKYGRVNERGSSFIEDDVDFPLVLALEDSTTKLVEGKNKNGKTFTRKLMEWFKSKIFSERTIFPRNPPLRVDTAEDGYQVSMNFLGRVDPEYVSRLSGQDLEATKARLRETGLAFENPASGQWEPSWRYLSGDVKTKLEEARNAAQDNPQYQANTAALEKIQPAPIAFENISFKLGSTFIPPEIVQNFMRDKLGLVDATVERVPQTGNWLVSAGYRGVNESLNRTTYGIHDFGGGDMVALALNLKTPKVTKLERRVGESGKAYDAEVKDPKATLEALEKQGQVKRAFVEWVRQDPESGHRIERVYNDTANRFRAPAYDPPTWSHYPGASEDITLRPHQMRVVTRMLQDSTMLAHAVGTGKTFAMITAAMEMRRLGLAKKPMIVVQNATLEQFARSFKRLYPTSRILVPSMKQRDSQNRQRTMSRIATGDWDAVIIPQSFVNLLPDNPAREQNLISDQITKLKDALIEAKAESGERAPKAADLQRAVDRLEKRLADLADRPKDNVLDFDQLGVDALFVDEAHAYKKLQFSTKMDNIKGLDTGASQRGLSMFLKARAIQEKNQGRNVIFATGTPVSNTIAEVWTMMRYLRPDILKKFGMEDFDSFAANFGDTVSNWEMTAGGTWKEVTRFARYTNGPELIAAWRTVADVITPEEVNLPGLPAVRGGKTQPVIIEQTPQITAYVQELRAELEAFDAMSGKEKRDNSHIPLVVFGRARKATLDMRLINPDLPEEPASKLNRVADEIARIHKESADAKGAQMVFADLYQSPDGRFNLYEELKKKLIQRGIPENEILIIGADLKEGKRETAFQRLNDGDVRVAIGSTERMGVGVNAQEHLVALHHMDAPARPMDVEQRNGRIVRQGNQNPIVDLMSYGVKNTLDAALFQRLATKQKFINQILRGDLQGRNFEDAANEVTMSFDEQMAAFSGDPLALEKVTLEASLRTLETFRSAHFEQVRKGREQLGFLRQRGIPATESSLNVAKQDAARARAEFGDMDKVQMRYGERVFTGKKDITKLLEDRFSTAIENAKKEATALAKQDDAARSFEQSLPGFSIGGLQIELRVGAKADKVWLDKEQTKQGWGPSEGVIGWQVHGEGTNWRRVTTGNGFFSSLDAVLRDTQKQPERLEADLASKKREVLQLESFIKLPFEREAELSEATKRYADVLDKIKNQGTAGVTAATKQEVAPLGFEVARNKPIEGQRQQIRRILDQIEATRDERDLPPGYRAGIADALNARLREIEQEMLVKAKAAPVGVHLSPADSGQAPIEPLRFTSAHPDKYLDSVVQRVGDEFLAATGQSPRPGFLQRVDVDLDQSGAELSHGMGEATRREVERVFNRKIIFVAQPQNLPVFNGAFPDHAPGVVLLNAKASRPLLTVTGHELVHAIKQQDPVAFVKLMDALRPEMQNIGGYAGRLEGILRAHGASDPRVPIPEAEVELISDFVGDNFTEPTFWKGLADRAPQIFTRIAGMVTKFLRGLVNKLKGFESYQYFKDVEKARSLVSDAIVEFAKKSGSPLSYDEFGDPHFSLEPISSEEEYRKMTASARAGLTDPADAAFNSRLYGSMNSVAIGHLAPAFAALPPEVKATIPTLAGRLDVIKAAERDVPGWTAPVGDLRTQAQAFSTEPWARQKFVALANNEMMNLVDETRDHTTATREAAAIAAQKLADEQAKVPVQRLAELGHELINLRRGQVIAERTAARQRNDAVAEAAADNELDALKDKVGETAVGEVISAILKTVPDTLLMNPMTPRSDILRAWNAAKATVTVNASPDVIASVERTIAGIPDIAVRLNGIKHPEKSTAVHALEERARVMAEGQRFLQQALASPEFARNYAQAIDLTGSRGLIAKENPDHKLSWDNPLDPQQSVTLRQDQTLAGYHHDVAALEQVKGWLEDYLDPQKNPDPDPLKVPAVQEQLDAINQVHLHQMFNPESGKPLVTGGLNPFAFVARGIGPVAQIADYTMQMAGGPASHAALMSLVTFSEFRRGSQQADNRLAVTAMKATAKAAKAHSLDPVQWGVQIGDRILASYAVEGVPPKRAGMKVNGRTITQGDMDAVRAGKGYIDGQRAAAETVMTAPAARGRSIRIRDLVGTTRFERNPQPTGEFTVPQRLAANAISFVKEWNSIKDSTLSDAQKLSEFERLLDGKYRDQALLDHVSSFDDPQYAAYAESPFRSIYVDLLKLRDDTGTMPVASVQELTDHIFNEQLALPAAQQMAPADIRQQIIGELDRAVHAFTAEEQRTTKLIDPDATNIEVASAENFMNRPRGRRILPRGFYTFTTGLNPEQDQIRFQVAQVFAQRVIRDVQNLRDTLARQQGEWADAIKKGKLTEDQIRASQKAGENFLNYSEVVTAKAAAESYLETFRQYTVRNMGQEENILGPLNVFRNTIAGAALQRAPSMLNNFLGAPFQMAILDSLVLRGGKNALLRFAPIGATYSSVKAIAAHGKNTVDAIIGTILNQPKVEPRWQKLAGYMRANQGFFNHFAGYMTDYMERQRARVENLREIGVWDDDPIRYNLDALTSFPTTGGKLTGERRGRGRQAVDLLRTSLLLGTETGLVMLQAPRVLGVSGIEQVNNAFADYAAAKIVQSLVLNSDRAFKTRLATGYDPQKSILTPQEIFGHKNASGADAANLRQYFERAGLNLDRALIEYWQKRQAGNTTAELLSPAEHAALSRESADFLNKGSFKNRPLHITGWARWMGMFFGYGLNQNVQMARLFARYSRDERNPLWGHGLDMFAAAVSLYTITSVMGALGQPVISWLKRWLYNEESPNRSLLDARTVGEAFKINTMNQAGQMPLLGRAFVSSVGAALPGTQTQMFGLQVFPVSVYNNLSQATSKFWQTGGKLQVLADYWRNLIPNSRIVLNRTPYREGTTNEGNLRADLAAHAPKGVDVKVSQYQTGTVQYSPARGQVDAVINALSRSSGPDMDTVRTERAAGIARLVAAGKSEEEAAKTFDRAILARNPFLSVFGRNLTESEMHEVRSSMTDEQRANLDRVVHGRQAYAAAYDYNEPSYTRDSGGSGGPSLATTARRAPGPAFSGTVGVRRGATGFAAAPTPGTISAGGRAPALGGGASTPSLGSSSSIGVSRAPGGSGRRRSGLRGIRGLRRGRTSSSRIRASSGKVRLARTGRRVGLRRRKLKFA